MPPRGKPPQLAFTARERRVIDRCRTPAAVQGYLNRLPYNTEPPPGGATLRSFRGVVRTGTVHCMRDPSVAARLLQDYEKDLADCTEMTLERWQRRPVWEKVVGPFVWILERQQ